MAENEKPTPQADEGAEGQDAPQAEGPKLEGGTYEILRKRLAQHAGDLRGRLDRLNAQRKDVFGSIDFQLLGSQRVPTDNNCVPRDMIALGRQFLFGYNVFIGLRAETTLEDVFSIYEWDGDQFNRQDLSLIGSEKFLVDFKNLYKYYRETRFAKFMVIGPHLFMVFRVGKAIDDVKTFKWLMRGGTLEYLDNRSDHECVFPSQHEFEWRRVTLDMHRQGVNPHISIEDRVFVECVGGDLTIKVEDNTATGEGIYSEPVDNADQNLDDAEISYSIVGNVILLKVRPYQEQDVRYFVYNEKIQQARRLDAIAEACVLLPGGHGLIFPKGYYLQTGEVKTFETDMANMLFERRLAAPNGEDYLFVFFNRDSGTYVLLSYNIIEQKVSTPVVCHGYSIFEDGKLLFFRADGEAQKSHTIQIWQSPYTGPDFTQDVQTDSFLYKIGNRDVVRCMAECNELLLLVRKEDTYANLYVDLVKRAQDVLDSFFWIGDEHVGNLAEPLEQVRAAAQAAIDEFDKVVRARQNTAQQTTAITNKLKDVVQRIGLADLASVEEFVAFLSELRTLRGEIIALRDLRYVDGNRVDQLEQTAVAHAEDLSAQTVEFLLKPDALDGYRTRVEAHGERVTVVTKVVEAKDLQKEVMQTGSDLEMLTEVVANLKIDDATKTASIIDSISLVYSKLNQVKAALKNRIQQLAGVEGKAEFASQIKLIDQAATNYLDLCETPEACDDYLGRLMAQLEGLESRFADFDEFIVQLAEKREELYNGFESRKVQLVEARNRRATALMAAGERVIKGIRNRVGQLEEIGEINAYFASDIMIDRLRETIRNLESLGDTVKAEDLRSQLKAIQQDSVRQLKDRLALYEDGENVIRFGEHRFSVNKQSLELTMIQRDREMFFHLTGTGFFQPVECEDLAELSDVWDLEVVSESPSVYRSEYLAFRMLADLRAEGNGQADALLELEPDALQAKVAAYMAPRYAEGYVKGVHDADGATILRALLTMERTIGLLRFPADARALARMAWMAMRADDDAVLLAAQVAGVGHARALFPQAKLEGKYVAELAGRISAYVESTGGLFQAHWIEPAAAYLFEELANGKPFVVSQAAGELAKRFGAHVSKQKADAALAEALDKVATRPALGFRLLRDWIGAFVAECEPAMAEYVDEAAAVRLDDDANRTLLDASTVVMLEGLSGSHKRIVEGKLELNYCDAVTRLRHHDTQIAPRFLQFHDLRRQLIEDAAEALRLSEFRPRVLTTFVRNKLIDKVYLPLVGDNLAKQIGSAGDTKRTDRQGLLLLISPPGYGKTTLMEYIANRLGLIFMKINGPAIGNQVTSLDPNEARNAAAREEVQKLNLALEMGDNVMIYVDDIQHCNPEFLQKFISLCDAQRRMEGVFRGKTRTYDLRGKRVAVVMAGNPYTESGEKFRIPDMLANRADTYNIGDIVGDSYDVFVSSYVENCLTSNPVLASLANRSQADVYSIMQLVETGSQEGVDFEGNYTPDEIHDFVETMRKLYVVRQVVLKVNQQYIASAAQADAYRTEPQFLLQGSYRNMNRIAARVLPVMNEHELWTLIESTYEQDAQTLTTGAESNLLKFRELIERMDDAQQQRWADIKRTFRQNTTLGESDDKVEQIVRQLGAFGGGLDSIRETLSSGVTKLTAARQADADKPGPAAAALAGLGDRFETFGKNLGAIRAVLADGIEKVSAPRGDGDGKAAGRDEIRAAADGVQTKLGDVIKAIRAQQKTMAAAEQAADNAEAAENARTLISVLEEQFRTMEVWLRPVARSTEGRQKYVQELVERFEDMVEGYGHLIEVLQKNQHKDDVHALPEQAADETPRQKRKKK